MSLEYMFKALEKPVRREILEILKDGKLSAGEIVKKFDLSSSTISYHLTILKKAGLVTEEKYKNYIYYEINLSIFEELMLWISQFKEIEGKNEDDKKV